MSHATGNATSRKKNFTIPVEVNYPSPSLTLIDISGKEVSLEDYRGLVVLINNWATWCPPCKAEMPAMQAYYEAHASEGFTIIAIEAGQPVEEVQRFIDEYGLTFQVWLDPKNKALDVFKNMSLPSSYLIDRDGVIKLAWSGAINLAVMEEFITPLINE